MGMTKQGWIKRKLNGNGVAWNKGKKFPEISGVNNPRYSCIILNCWECKKEFKVKNYRKETAHFCSHKCSSLFRDEGKRTIDKKIRQSWAYKLWRKAVFIKDNYTCKECGDSNYEGRGRTIVIQADHIKPFALNPELRFEISNGRTLCETCHKKTSTYGRGAIYRNHCIASA